MMDLFKNVSTFWVRFSDYHIQTANNGKKYLTAVDGATPEMIYPLDNAKQLVLDTVNIGLAIMGKKPRPLIEQDILKFAKNYGLLGLMTALPTTPRFMDYQYVYLPKNDFIRAESMETVAYTDLFFPFKKPTYRKDGDYVEWDVEGDVPIQALMLTCHAYTPIAMQMSFLREYAEDIEWQKKVFKSFAFNFLSVFFYYNDPLTEDEKETLRWGMRMFEGSSPTCHIALEDNGPMLIWDFHSLLHAIQMAFAFTMTDPHSPIKMCKNCDKAFFASRPNQKFCSDRCGRYYRMRHPKDENDK